MYFIVTVFLRISGKLYFSGVIHKNATVVDKLWIEQ